LFRDRISWIGICSGRMKMNLVKIIGKLSKNGIISQKWTIIHFD
jgi:hypothetical protein